MPGVVYRAFDAEGALLYVGASINPPQRLYAHASDRPWWVDVARVTLEHFDTREQAYAAEAAAIEAEDPKFNIVRGSRRVVSEEEIERRRQARDEEQRRASEKAERFYPVHGEFVCGNCRKRPIELPKRVLIADVECPRCACKMIAPVEQEGAA